MTIAPAQSYAILPTLADLHDRTRSDVSPWVRLDVQGRRTTCDCDPTVPYQCRRCFIRDDVAYERSLDI